MSAILGIFNLDGRPADTTWLEKMWSGLSHRGSDGGRVWSDGPVGLGHQMLWTTPESLEERMRQLQTEWNATAADYPREMCVQELFEAQASCARQRARR